MPTRAKKVKGTEYVAIIDGDNVLEGRTFRNEEELKLAVETAVNVGDIDEDPTGVMEIYEVILRKWTTHTECKFTLT